MDHDGRELGEHQFFETAELEHLFRVLKELGSQHPWWHEQYRALRFIAETGCRPIEASWVLRSHVQERGVHGGRLWSVLVRTAKQRERKRKVWDKKPDGSRRLLGIEIVPKKEKIRRIWLDPSYVEDFIPALWREDEFWREKGYSEAEIQERRLFPYPRIWLRRALNRAMDAAKLDLDVPEDKRRNLRSLRHTRAVYLWDSVGDINYIKDQLGHADIKTTQVYMHVSRRKVAENVQAINQMRRRL